MNKKTTNILSLSVQFASKVKNLPTRAQFRRWVKTAIKKDINMTLRVVDEPEGRELNNKFRGRDYATNVLTFVYDELKVVENCSPEGKSAIHGDVVICAPVVEHEAAEQHKELLAHYALLSIHAALHLQGYEHEEDTEAEEMETIETALMLKLNYPDPYKDDSKT